MFKKLVANTEYSECCKHANVVQNVLDFETMGRVKGIADSIQDLQSFNHCILSTMRGITFREIKNSIPLAICQARYIRFFWPNSFERSETKELLCTSKRPRLSRKKSRRFPYEQYSIITQSSEILPATKKIREIMNFFGRDSRLI